ncbi:MAG TPA: hypothetical protein VK530_01300 [Candidatus Acidoferrum sp.]|nr:hypothetical protein [Candidatus Acidoferrum sp.]
MKTSTVLLLLAVSALQSFASSISGSGSEGTPVVVALTQPKKVALSLTLPADLVSVPIRITSELKNSTAAYEESRQAVDNGRVRVSTGVASLGQHQSGFGISGGSWKQPAAVTEMHLLVPLTKDRDDIFAASVEASRFVESLRLPGKMTCEMGKVQLAVENPEQHRVRLLAQIAAQIRETRIALGVRGNVRVDGLESPVMVRQADDRNVELFLSYSISAAMDNESRLNP